jgi:signal transduction histidine kinase
VEKLSSGAGPVSARGAAGISVARQRLALGAGLAAMVWAMTTHRGGAGLHGSGLHISVALAVASACWLGWIALGPHGDTLALRSLTACTAISGAVLLLLYPSLAVYWFTFWACVNAGLNFADRVAVPITAASAAILVGGYLTHRGTILAAFAAVAFVGYTLGRERRRYLAEARAATLAERGRIARELHDVIGHSLTGVSLQIESGAAALEAAADSDRALTHLEQAGRLVRTGHQEAVAAVRTLREGQVAMHAMLAGLIESHRAAGGHAQLSVTGMPRALDAAPALALYRVTQEALTNAARHAPAKLAHVQVGYGDSELTVSVVNDIGCASPATLSGGYGLPGMRERMAEAGGTLSAGQAGDQWRVEARVSA